MSHAETQKPQAAVRLRRPERRQVAMVVQCPDDLVSANHAVRMVMGVVSFIEGSPVSIVRGMGIIICKRGRLECENLMVSILGPLVFCSAILVIGQFERTGPQG